MASSRYSCAEFQYWPPPPVPPIMGHWRSVVLPINHRWVIPCSLQTDRRGARFLRACWIRTVSYSLRVLPQMPPVAYPIATRIPRPHCARRRDIRGGTAIILFNLDRGVSFGCRCATNEQRQRKALALHLFRHVNHLVQRRGNQTRQADNIHLLFPCSAQNFSVGTITPRSMIS